MNKSRTKLIAKWENAPRYMYYCYTCSNCKHSVSIDWWTDNKFCDDHRNRIGNYCPVCGARMTV